MASPVRRENPPLDRLIFKEPYRFEFFQAVRVLRRVFADRAPVGGKGPPRNEVVRFHAHNSSAFPPSEIFELEQGRDEETPPDMTVAFMGLTGPLGVLPEIYTEFLIERERDGDLSASAFFDLFNHRMISLFFRAWEKYRPAQAYETGDVDHLARAIYALVGFGLSSLRQRHDFPDTTLLFHVASFAQRRRSALMLEALLRSYFGLEIVIEQFVGRWITLEKSDCSALGSRAPGNGMGEGMLLGRKVWDQGGKFRVRVGPLTYAQYLDFLPDGSGFRALTQMTRTYVDAEFDFDVQLILKASEVPRCRLACEPSTGARMGRDVWVKSLPLLKDPDDAIFPSPC